MRYPLKHGTTACQGPMPRIWITDADNKTIAHAVGATAEQARLNARFLVDACNREAAALDARHDA